MKITIPESLEEIQLQHFQDFANTESTNEEFILLKMVSLFCNISIKEARNIKSKDFSEIVEVLKATLNKKPEFVQSFTLGGVEYGFIPDLDDMSIGEDIDINKYLSDVTTFHNAMAVLYRPIISKSKDTYLIEDYETSNKYAGVMKFAPLSVFLGAKVFFYNLGNELLKHTITSIQVEAQTNTQLKEYLQQNGDGINQSMHLLEEMFSNLMPSLN